MPLLGRRHSLFRVSSPQLLLWLLLGVIGYLAIMPIGMLVFTTFAAHGDQLPSESKGVSLTNYLIVFGDTGTYTVLLDTAIFAIGSTAIGIGVAACFAWLIERTDLWGRAFFFVLILAPMAIPNMIYAMAWTQLLNPNNGLINVALAKAGLGFINFNVLSLSGMVFVQGIALASHAYLLVAAPFRMVDPTWEEQSKLAGRGIFATLWRITLPVLKPALLAAILFFTIVSVETFDIPITLGLSSGVHVLSTNIYWATHPESGAFPSYGIASTFSVILLVIAAFFIYFYQRQTADTRQFVTITGRGFRPARLALGRWRLPVFLLAAAFVLIAVVLPLFMLIWRSLLPFYMYPSAQALDLASIKAYTNLFTVLNLAPVLSNTAIMAVSGAAATVVLASLTAWLILRKSISRGWRVTLNTLAFSPQAMPSIVIGLAFIFVYLWLPVGLYGTIWIIVLAMITRYLAYATATMIAANAQVSDELEEASRIAGAGWGRTYYRVTAPLVAPALLSCFLWVAIHIIRELGLALMLYSPGTQVLSTKVWNLWENGNVSQASALGVLTICALVLLLGLPWAIIKTRQTMRYFQHFRHKSAASAVAVPRS